MTEKPSSDAPANLTKDDVRDLLNTHFNLLRRATDEGIAAGIRRCEERTIRNEKEIFGNGGEGLKVAVKSNAQELCGVKQWTIDNDKAIKLLQAPLSGNTETIRELKECTKTVTECIKDLKQITERNSTSIKWIRWIIGGAVTLFGGGTIITMIVMIL